MKVEEVGQEEDEFLKFYRQYRPSHRQNFDVDNRSEWSSATTTNRSDYSGPFLPGFRRDKHPGGSRGGSWSRSSAAGSAVMNSSVYGGGGGGTRGHKQLSLRSKSFGRDPRFTDLQNSYKRLEPQDFSSQSSNPSSSQGYQSDSRTGAEDSLSRDSGHSSAGTPELARRGIYRNNSCPSPSEPSNGIYSNFSVKDRLMNGFSCADDTGSVFSYTSLQQPRHNYRGPQYYSKDWCDDWCDTYSMGSLDTHLQNWNRQVVTNRKAKRKFDSFSEEEDDCVTDSSLLSSPQPPTKRPRTPVKVANSDMAADIEVEGVCRRVLRLSARLACLLGLIMFSLVSVIFILELVDEYHCSQHKSVNIDLHELEHKFNTSLFGQSIAEKEVLSALRQFTSQGSAEGTNTPILVVVLVGWTGTGKTHTTNLVAATFPVPANIHRIAGASIHTNPVIQELPQIIRKSCGYSLVIADDVPDNPAITSKLENLIQSLHSEEEGRGNGSVVLVSSSAGGHLINRFILDKVLSDRPSDLNNGGISSVLASVDGESVRRYLDEQKSQIPLSSFLQVYSVPHLVVPYLPLTRESVRSCILAELRESGAQLSSGEVHNIMKQVPFFTQQYPVFSKTGCKRIAAKVMLSLRLQENNLEL